MLEKAKDLLTFTEVLEVLYETTNSFPQNETFMVLYETFLRFLQIVFTFMS